MPFWGAFRRQDATQSVKLSLLSQNSDLSALMPGVRQGFNRRLRCSGARTLTKDAP